MVQSQMREEEQVDPVDGSFNILFLAQLHQYLACFAEVFPDQRLFRCFAQAVKGVMTAGVPIVTPIAAAVIQSHDPKRTFHVAKRYYRWLENPRFGHQGILKPAYAQTRALFQDNEGAYTLVLLDFTNLEKPYGYKLKGLSILKASGLRTGPRCRRGKVPGYHQLLGLAVKDKKVGLTFAKTISYVTEDFVSLNRDISRAIRYSHVILKGQKVRFVCDRDFDDEKTFAFVTHLEVEFVIRLYLDRTLQVQQGQERLEKLLGEVVKEMPQPIRFDAWFKIRGRWRKSYVSLGYRQVWLLGHDQPYWLVVSNVYGLNPQWMLLTNIPITSPEQAKEIWFNYRRRWRIESTFRFLQREGLRWEDSKALDLEPIRQLVNLVLIAAIFLLDNHLFLDEAARQILLTLGGRQGLKSERDDPYLLLTGWQKFLACLNTLAILKRHGKLPLLSQALDAL